MFRKIFMKTLCKEKIVVERYICEMFTKLNFSWLCSLQNTIIIKFLVLHVCKHKMSRSRILWWIILYIIPPWLINVLWQISQVFMHLVRKSHLFFFQKMKNVARNWFMLLIPRTGHLHNILLSVSTLPW